LLKYLKVVKESEVNGSSRPNETQMIMLKDIKSNLLPNILLRKMALTTKQKIFSLVSKKDLLKIIMVLVIHYNLELHQMEVKNIFLSGNLEKKKSLYGST
jgi:uncharacterized membrane protein YoaT (DUF817 family)